LFTERSASATGHIRPAGFSCGGAVSGGEQLLGRIFSEICPAQRLDPAMKSSEGDAGVARLNPLSEKGPYSLLKVGLCLPSSEGTWIESKLVAVKQASQLGYLISGNSPFGNSVF
jgi:hypothetical protein